jgi:hypothetical protein
MTSCYPTLLLPKPQIQKNLIFVVLSMIGVSEFRRPVLKWLGAACVLVVDLGRVLGGKMLHKAPMDEYIAMSRSA